MKNTLKFNNIIIWQYKGQLLLVEINPCVAKRIIILHIFGITFFINHIYIIILLLSLFKTIKKYKI